MTIAHLARYLRAAAGLAWATLRQRPCACAFCRSHRAWAAATEGAYRAELRGLGVAGVAAEV